MPVAVALGDNRAVRVWDPATGQRVSAELVSPDAVSALAVALVGRLAVAFGSEVAVLAAAHCQEPQAQNQQVVERSPLWHLPEHPLL
jgi:hypothetical protein